MDKCKPPVCLIKGAPIAATDPQTGERIVFETGENLMVTSLELKRLLTQEDGRWMDNTRSNEEAGVFYFAFGDDPGRGDGFYLGFDATKAFPTGEIKLTVRVFEGDPPGNDGTERTNGNPEIMPSAELAWHYWNGNIWKPLRVDDGTVALTRSGRLRFDGPEDITKATIGSTEQNFLTGSDETLYWIRASIKTPGYEIPPRIDTILLNTVSATHGETIRRENALGNGLPFQAIHLKHKPVLAGTLRLAILEEDDKWYKWKEVADFDASGPEARHYAVDAHEGVIRFGDDVNGHIPPRTKKVDNIVIIKYRTGGGEKGNVKAETITEVLDSKLEKK